MRINKRFQQYIDNKNVWASLTNQKEITFPLTNEDVKYLSRCLSSDLSPENLHCDGEISANQARVKANKLNGVVKDLTAYAKKKGLVAPSIYY